MINIVIGDIVTLEEWVFTAIPGVRGSVLTRSLPLRIDEVNMLAMWAPSGELLREWRGSFLCGFNGAKLHCQHRGTFSRRRA